MKKPTPSMTITTSSMADHPQVRFKLQASNRQLSLANNLEERDNAARHAFARPRARPTAPKPSRDQLSASNAPLRIKMRDALEFMSIK